MPNPRIRMSVIREVLRLRFESGLSHRKIARAVGVSLGSVAGYLTLFERCGVSYPQTAGLDEASLTALMAAVRPPPAPPPPDSPAVPDFQEIHEQLRRKGVTRQILWEEYAEAHPAGHYRYSQFCHLYREWRSRLRVTLRQTYRAGEKMFVDYAGPTVDIVDPATGEAHPAQIFVAVLGASNYTFAEATLSQKLEDWTGSHVRAFEYFGGAPEMVVPDNLKSAVTKACRYEPLLNDTYREMLAHYGTCGLPARPREPQDKAKVESGVQVVERWILARLRKRTFFSLFELNLAIRELLVRLNDKKFQKLAGSRLEKFAELDRPALRPLPETPYEYAEWRKARVHFDCHIEVAGCFYSVPFTLIKQQIDVRLTAKTVECFRQGKPVAVHLRRRGKGHYSTDAAHMPANHRAHLEWTPERLRRWATQVGSRTHALVDEMIDRREHPEMAYRSCLGLLRLVRSYSSERLEKACDIALKIGSPTRSSVASILREGLDSLPSEEDETVPELPAHANIRGAEYYRRLIDDRQQGENQC